MMCNLLILMVPIIGVKHSINLVLMPSPTTITN